MNTTRLLQRLRHEIRGQVLADDVTLGLYATDASMYQITPLAVVTPLHRADALRAIRICGEEFVPIVPRGGGTSLSGQTIARGVVLDLSRHLHRVLEIDVARRWARVEPGVVRDELNMQLKPHGLHFSPDPSTANRANIGGMIANNSGGMRSNKYGTTIDHVLELDLALPTGEVLNLRGLSVSEFADKRGLPDREGDIYRGVGRILEEQREEIELRFPKSRRRSSGYMLDHLLAHGPFNLCKLISASEGTLGVVLEAKLNLTPLARANGLLVAHFHSLRETLQAVAPIVAYDPSSVEMLDHVIINQARDSLLGRELCHFIEGRPAAVLIVEFEGDTGDEVDAALGRLVGAMRERQLGYALPVMRDAKAVSDVWNMRRNGLGLMTLIKGDRKPTPFVEDAAMPLEELPAYIEAIVAVCERHHHPVSVYAHAGAGLCHVRPMLDLHRPEEITLMRTIAEEVFELVLAHRGSLSGEHGDGLVRSGFNERFFGPRLYAAFQEVKRLFDPLGLMNPGKIVNAPPMTENLRFGPGYRVVFDEAQFHYRDEGGLRQAVEQCTGVGACRKTLDGTMCPSYIATRDEQHSTRARANALRLAITGQLGPEAFGGERMHEVFDLCIACKGCKAECPNGVDASRFKAEFLHARYRTVAPSLRDRLFASSPRHVRRASGWAAPVVNALQGSSALRKLLDVSLGIDARRPLPRLAAQKFSAWFERRGRRAVAGSPVILFADTYLENHEPSIGRAAVELLEAAGCTVRLANAGCCQRPALSKGFLDQAREEGARTLRALDEPDMPEIPILVLEPSCASALSDDLPDLIGDAELGRRVASRVTLFEDFLARRVGQLPWPADLPARKYLLHGHCHQKALFKSSATLELLRAMPNANAQFIDAGCCGMAGSFGYEKEHYEISLKIGEDRLFPAIRRNPAAELVANGFSCRHQIADVTGRTARHVAEVLREALEFNPQT